MSERPLNERPAARPVQRSLPESAESKQASLPTAKPSFWSSLGCLGWSVVIFIAIATISLVGSGIQSAIRASQMSAGTVEYDISPANPDPRETYPISEECDATMAASAADPSEKGEALLIEAGNICKSKAEWEAALYKYPGAIGGSSSAYLDGSEYDLVCSGHPQLYMCKHP